MNIISYCCYTCGAKQEKDFEGFTCPTCNGNLEIEYDYERIKRKLNFQNPFPGERKDIFKYLPLLPIQELTLAPPLRIGCTPLYKASRLGGKIGLPALYIKDEGLNPSGSFKDRASAVALVCAMERKAKVISAASTGNAGSSIACICASVNQECVIFVPEKAPRAKLAQLTIFGAHIKKIKGTYDKAFDLCLEASEKMGWYNRNTGHNPFTREGKKTCAFELCEQLDWRAPDRVVVPVGDGNIISGIWKGLKELFAVGLINHLPKVDCAQAVGSAAISHAVETAKVNAGSSVQITPVQADTLADSISVDYPRDGQAAVRAVIESGGATVRVTDQAILNAIQELAIDTGVFVEPAAAAAWAGLKKLVEAGTIGSNEQVVCLLTGNGLKDIDSVQRITANQN